MLNALQRFLPVLFALVLLITLGEFLRKHWPSPASQSEIILFFQHCIWYLVTASVIGWIFVLLGWMHEKNRLPLLLKRPTLMDILDRLTNRQDVENGLEDLETVTYVDAESLAGALKQRIIGQDDVCDDIAAQIRRRLALIKRGKPIGVFLFAGPPGTGKTLLAKVLAKELERELLHLDMSQYASGSHALSQLLGMTKGYVGSDSYGVLTAGLRDTPDAIVLLDEIEKAHPDILKAFLTAWNDGFITERSDGTQISTTSAIFIMTSNAATDRLIMLSAQKEKDQDAMRVAAINTLKEAQFAPEVLNRIDRIFVFQQLEGLDVARVAALEIEQMIHSYGLEVTKQGIDPKILLMLMGRLQKMGRTGSSRDLVRAIEEKLADSLIEAKRKGFTEISLSINDQNTVTAKAIRKEKIEFEG